MRLNYNIDFSLVEKYFDYKDSYAYYLSYGFETGNLKYLYLRLSDRRIYFVNGSFFKGLKLLNQFNKWGWLNV